MVRTPMKSRSKYTGPTMATTELVIERANYACEINGCLLGDVRGVDWSIQHRAPRQSGGTIDPRYNQAPNLLLVCGSAVTGCHGLIEDKLRAEAYTVGWLLKRGQDPASERVLILRQRFVWLTVDGRYADHPPEGVES